MGHRIGAEIAHVWRAAADDGAMRTLLRALGQWLGVLPATSVKELGGEESLLQLVNGTEDYAILTLDVDGRVSTWNAGAERIKGYRAEEITGQHFSVLYPPEDLAEHKPDRELEIAATAGRYEEEGWRVRKDGTQFWANVVISALRDEQGQVVGYGIVTRDITLQYHQNEQIADAAMELSEANETLRRQADELSQARDVATTVVHRQEFGRRLANALDMSDGEPEVVEVIGRSFASVLPDRPVELLLADNSHAHLRRLTYVSPTGTPPGCQVDSPHNCPAARRAQIQFFDDSEALDACPKLRGRPEGALSAVCVPVSIMGRTVGVIHATGQPSAKVPDDAITDLGSLANLAGARMGLLRVMAETQLQATTDSLTGLLNRRAFEHEFSTTRPTQGSLSVAMADLDHFKALNDTYGHDTGDRALRLFAQVLTDSLRAGDLIGRHGGEEFVLALPGCPAATARRLLDAIRERISAAITVAGLPGFTASFGVVDARDHEDLPTLIGRADAALFAAKRDGRDRVVVHDATGVAGPPEPVPSTTRILGTAESSVPDTRPDGHNG